MVRCRLTLGLTDAGCIKTVSVADWPRNSGGVAGGLGFSGLADLGSHYRGLAVAIEPSFSSLMGLVR